MHSSAETENLEPITRGTKLRGRTVIHAETGKEHRVIATDYNMVILDNCRGGRVARSVIEEQFRIAPEPDRKQNILFCCLCFASGDNSSWGEGLVEGHCFNCGAGGSTFSLPRYAVESIREQASWVGKRYYPHMEDVENSEERKRLLACVTEFPGRTIEPAEEMDREGNFVRQEGRWNVKQKAPDGTWSSTSVQAQTEEEAWEKARYCGLTYYDEKSLKDPS